MSIKHASALSKASAYNFTGRGVLKQSSDNQLMSAFMADSSPSSEALKSTRSVCCDVSRSSRTSSRYKRKNAHSQAPNKTNENHCPGEESKISKTRCLLNEKRPKTMPRRSNTVKSCIYPSR